MSKTLIVNTFKKNIDTYIFILCQEYKTQLQKIEKNLTIKIPREIYKKFSGDKTDYIDTYIDNKHLILVGYGKKNICNKKYLMEVAGMIGKKLYLANESIFIYGSEKLEMLIAQISGIILGYYKFDKYHTNINGEDNTKIYIYSPKKFISELNDHIGLLNIQNEIRELVNEPANILNSVTYEKYIQKNLPPSVKIKIYNTRELKKLGLNLILAVNRGSENPAKLIVLTYNGNSKTNKNVCLVGKGVMFDTGGLNIKMGDFSDMKTDMTGSAIAFGVVKGCAILKKKVNVIAVLPIVENSVDSKSTRPGDIIKSYNGKTVEITDTDAEGRLILADALAFTEKYKPSMIIDIATLTGAAAYLFGEMATAIMGNDNNAIEQYKIVSENENEKVWELPMWEEYVELTKSEVADYKNLTLSANAGAIMGGAFLSNFIPSQNKNKDKKISWIHLDIAGVSYLNNETDSRFSGATGETFLSIFKFINRT